MDTNEVPGAANTMTGRIKQAAGALTDNDQLKAEGAAQEAVGRVQAAYGQALDAVRDYVVREPLRAVVIAMAAGMWLMKRRMRPR